MDPFYHGPLRHFTDTFRQACGSNTASTLPDALADTGPSGKIARNLLISLSQGDQEILADYCTKKLREPRWASSRNHRELVKVVLDEISISAVGAAQELGLTFCSALNRVQDPWMRIQVSLILAELLSRTHTYAPSCAIAYVQTFRQFDTFLASREYERGAKYSLFEPIALANGNCHLAKDFALELVLPYGEDCLRLLWGLQAREEQDGNEVGVKTLRSEELYVADKLRGWVGQLLERTPLTNRSWHHDLVTALERSERGEGPQYTRTPDTIRSRAVEALIQDALKLLSSGNNLEAQRMLDLLQPALAADRDLHFTSLRNHFLQAGYLRALVIFRLSKELEAGCSPGTHKNQVRQIWRDTEALYNEPGTLWPTAVMETRMAALNEIPKDWRLPPAPFPL